MHTVVGTAVRPRCFSCHRSLTHCRQPIPFLTCSQHSPRIQAEVFPRSCGPCICAGRLEKLGPRRLRNGRTIRRNLASVVVGVAGHVSAVQQRKRRLIAPHWHAAKATETPQRSVQSPRKGAPCKTARSSWSAVTFEKVRHCIFVSHAPEQISEQC